MKNHTNAPHTQISIDEIRGIYPHLPTQSPATSALHHPAILVFVHDPENAANAAGQQFLADNNDFDKRAGLPYVVAADMAGADYKIFDLTPPERQAMPCPIQDVVLAMSYGMVTVEQGIDYVVIDVMGQETPAMLDKITRLDDIQSYGAMNIAAAYGACLAAHMAGLEILMPQALRDCLSRIADSEGIAFSAIKNTSTTKESALTLIQNRASAMMK